MLLVEITINFVVNYVSIDGHGLTHNWRPRIISFDAPQLGIPSNHGGYGKLTFGNITFNPILFQADWPPPVSCAITIKYTDTNEAAAETIFTGTAHLSSFTREAITYALYGTSYDETVAASTAYNDTLNNVITTILTAIPEITSVNTSKARASSPNVTHTTSAITLAIDLASEIAQFYSHLIYVVGSTAYLVDMLLDNGSGTLTEFDFFASPTYQYKSPVSVLSCTYGGTTYNKASSYPYGSPMSVTPYHTTQANIETALTNILALENAPRITFDMPMIAGNFPALGEKITIPDTAHVADLLSYVRARTLRYDFLNDKINIEGEGSIAAA